MAHSRRKSIKDMFPDLHITSQASSANASAMPFTRALKNTMRNSFPTWGSIKKPQHKAHFTLSMDRNYDYSYGNDDDDPDEHFSLTETFFNDVRECIQGHKLSQGQDIALEDFLLESLVSVIFGSNYIEGAGLGHDVTFRICKEILQESFDPSKIEIRSDEYQAALQTIAQRGAKAPEELIIRSRSEIVNHALAMKYILTELVLYNNPLTEELLKETHRILMQDIDSDDGISSTQYAGLYRNVNVYAAYSDFTHHQSVPFLMRTLVADYNKDLENAEKKHEVDPFYLAAKYGHKFVNIHPFLDGNGRVCRLLLNAIVLKYAGILVEIGEKDGDRDEYCNIAQSGGLKQVEFDEQDGEGKVPWGELASFVIKKSKGVMEKFAAKLKAD